MDDLRADLDAGTRAAGGTTAEHARAIDEILAALEIHDVETPDFPALFGRRPRGSDPVVKSVQARNVVFNWRKLLKAVLVVGGGLIVSAASGPLAPFVLVGTALAALPTLAELPEIELGDDHTNVTIALWKQFPDDQDVTVTALAGAVPDLAEERLQEVLDDLADLQVIRRAGETVHKAERIVMLRDV
jgi:hypothetical protein